MTKVAEFQYNHMVLKLSPNKDLNDITAALLWVVFLLLAAEKKTPKTGQP